MALERFVNVSEVKCENCKYSDLTGNFMVFEADNEPEVFEMHCRRHAPRPTLARVGEVTVATVVWPLVLNTASCGEYEEDLYESPE